MCTCTLAFCQMRVVGVYSSVCHAVSCFRSHFCMTYLAEWSAGCSSIRTRAHCLSGRGLIPLLKAHSRKYHFSKATHAHPACPFQPRSPILCVGCAQSGVLHEGGNFIKAKELFEHASTLQIFVPQILHQGRACLCALSCFSVPICLISLHFISMIKRGDIVM